MKTSADHFPPNVFTAGTAGPDSARRVLISPERYIQGPRVLGETGRYLRLLECRRVGILTTERGERMHGAVLMDSLRDANIEGSISRFGGECSVEEIERQSKAFGALEIDCLIALGGGKCIDTGKGVAFRLEVPIVIAPTLASNDAPCSALSVIYTPEGVFAGVEFYPAGPALVVVDTSIIAAAPARYLVAGIGDAMSTWYEADACWRNPNGMTVLGTRPTLAALAIARTCADTLFEKGVDAVAAVTENRMNDSLEDIIEANTLLSGIGFESGGLAGAHAFAQAYTTVPSVEKNFLHGEMVAMGTLAQLMMESNETEALRVAEFFTQVGLPVSLPQLGLDPSDVGSFQSVIEGAAAFPYISNMPVPVNKDSLTTALLEAHLIGSGVLDRLGDAPYQALHAPDSGR